MGPCEQIVKALDDAIAKANPEPKGVMVGKEVWAYLLGQKRITKKLASAWGTGALAELYPVLDGKYFIYPWLLDDWGFELPPLTDMSKVCF